jgi:hypothetical protein
MTFTCTHPGCGREFLPGPDVYIGPEDPNDNQCSPFMSFVELCKNCAGPTLDKMDDPYEHDY